MSKTPKDYGALADLFPRPRPRPKQPQESRPPLPPRPRDARRLHRRKPATTTPPAVCVECGAAFTPWTANGCLGCATTCAACAVDLQEHLLDVGDAAHFEALEIRAEFLDPAEDDFTTPLADILDDRRRAAESDAQLCERRARTGSPRDGSFARRARRAADIARQAPNGAPLVVDRAAGIAATSADRIFGW